MKTYKFKYLILFLFLFLLPTIGFNQVTKQWDKTYGGSDNDYARSMIKTSDGGCLLGGWSVSSSSGDKTEASRGSADYWIVKIDNNGNKVWDKTLGGSGTDYHGLSMLQTNDNGFIVGGFSNSSISGDKSENLRGDADYWIIKIDNNGNKIWDKTFGGVGRDELVGIVQTNDGGYLLGGWSSSNVGWEKSQNSKGGKDYWIIKIDNNGNKIWDKTLGGGSDDELNAIIPITNGFLLGGSSYSPISGDKTQNNKGNYDYWIVKIDNDGNKIWDKTFGGNLEDKFHSMVSSPDNTYLLSGYSTSSISEDKSEASRGFEDYWIIKIDNNGNKIWDRTFGSTQADLPTAITSVYDNNQGYIIGGRSAAPISGDKTQDSKGSNDYWLVRVASDGNKLWDAVIGSGGNDLITGIVSSGNGDFILGGYSGYPASGDKTQNGRGVNDYWIVKINSFNDPCFSTPSSLSSNWYFGKGVGLKFSANAPSVIANVAAGFDAIEGSASVSDINDVPLFYTDGEKLYKADGTVIKSDLGGSRSATQSSLFVPKPGSSDTYYLFVTGCEQCISPNVGVHCYEVNTNGSVSSSPTSVSANGERITAIKKPNVDEYWIISTTGAYVSATLLNNTGFSSTLTFFALQNILPNESHPYGQIGYLKASPDGSKLALVYQDRVFIFNFSVTTGAISNQITIDNLPFAYGLEFSADNNYLYVSTRGILSQIHQIDLESNTRTWVSNVANSQVGALQIGPDNHIYVAKWNSKYLGRITGASSASPSYEENAVLLGEGKFSRLGLPNLIRTPASTAGTRTDANQSDYASNANATGLALWLDASDLTSVFFADAQTEAVPVVFHWFDKSGNNRHFSINDGAYAPLIPVNDYWHFYANSIKTPEIHFIRRDRKKRNAYYDGSILVGGQEQNCNTNPERSPQTFPNGSCSNYLSLPIGTNPCISSNYNYTLPPPCPNPPAGMSLFPGEQFQHRILGVPMTIMVAVNTFGVPANAGRSHLFGVGENYTASMQGINNIWGLYLQDGVPTLRAKTDSGEGLEIRAKNADGTDLVVDKYTIITAVLRNDGGEIYINANSTPSAQPLAGDCSQIPRNNSLVDGGHIPTIGATRGALVGLPGDGIMANELHGAIGAIKVWNRVLTDAERISEVNIMKPKWNIQ
jgi:hypothetical protein